MFLVTKVEEEIGETVSPTTTTPISAARDIDLSNHVYTTELANLKKTYMVEFPSAIASNRAVRKILKKPLSIQLTRL